jgi:peptidoglycan/LPS O-acetylase OafA/YrhL
MASRPSSRGVASGGNDRTIPTLDGWRAVAILAVVICHGVPRTSLLWPLRLFGMHGVYIFFGISGFLITTKLLDEEKRKGRLDLTRFYLRRVFRILPPALTFVFVVAALGLLGFLSPMPFKEWFADVFFLQSYVGAFPGRTDYTGHFWSLAVEEHFYLLFPFLLGALGSKRLRRAVPWVCAAIFAWRLADDRWVHLDRFFPGVFPNQRTDRVADLLLWGCFLALLFRSEKVREVLARRLSGWVWYVLAAAFVAVVWKQPPFALTLEAILIPLLLAGTVLGARGIPARLLELSPMKALGRISYSVYLWQQLFFVAALREGRSEALSWPQLFPFNAALTLACALASYHLVEQPMIAWGRKLSAVLKRRRPMVAPGGVAAAE